MVHTYVTKEVYKWQKRICFEATIGTDKYPFSESFDYSFPDTYPCGYSAHVREYCIGSLLTRIT